MNLPIELRLGAVAYCQAKISGALPRASFEMPTAELDAPKGAGEGAPAAGGAMRSAPRPRRPMTDLQTEWLPLLETELARRRAKAQWDADRNEREWEELFATCAAMRWRMFGRARPQGAFRRHGARPGAGASGGLRAGPRIADPGRLSAP